MIAVINSVFLSAFRISNFTPDRLAQGTVVQMRTETLTYSQDTRDQALKQNYIQLHYSLTTMFNRCNKILYCMSTSASSYVCATLQDIFMHRRGIHPHPCQLGISFLSQCQMILLLFVTHIIYNGLL